MVLSTFYYTLAASVLVALVSLISAVFILVEDKKLERWMPRLIAVAVGVLLGDAFLHLLPDAVEIGEEHNSSVFFWALVGMLGFFFIETGLLQRGNYGVKNPKQAERSIESFAKMNLIGDGIHNFVDGILIASSFLVDPALGLATTIAIVLHEIPQEISDIAVLIKGGYKKTRAVTLNFLCALFCAAGAMTTLVLSNLMEIALGNMLALTAGGFIYIAAGDLFPLLRAEALRDSLPSQFLAAFLGVLSMQLILWLEALS